MKQLIRILSVIIGFLSLISIAGVIETESDLTLKTNVTKLTIILVICLLSYLITTFPIAIKYTIISIVSHIVLYLVCVYVFLGFGSDELDQRLRESYENSISWKSFWHKESIKLKIRINKAYEKECKMISR